MGNRFQLSISKLLKKKSIVNFLSLSDNRTYFCSELIAAALKYVKLLPQELSSTQYWPSMNNINIIKRGFFIGQLT